MLLHGPRLPGDVELRVRSKWSHQFTTPQNDSTLHAVVQMLLKASMIPVGG